MCEELQSLFPTHGHDTIALAVIKAENNIDLACDYLLEGLSSTEPDTTAFELLPEVLDAWNEKIDLDDIERGFAEFESANQNTRSSLPITIRDAEFFKQLVDRFGAPHPCYIPSASDSVTIPADLAKQVYEWWSINLEEVYQTDEHSLKVAQELQDQEVALQLQQEQEAENYKLKQRTKRLAQNQGPAQDFPELNPNGPIHYPQRALPRGGQWINKKSLGHREKVAKLKQLFPELPEARLTEFLADSRGNVTEATKNICLITDKNEESINQKRSEISRTRTAPSASAVADCLGDIEPCEGTYDQIRSEGFELLEKAKEAAEKAAYYARRNEGHTAQFYAQQSAEFRKRGLEAQTKSAEAIFVKNNAKYRDNSVIDLHGLHINEGLKKLQETIKKSRSSELQVITGRGQNSAFGYGKIQVMTLYLWFLRKNAKSC